MAILNPFVLAAGLIALLLFGLSAYALVLGIRALRKYVRSAPVRREQSLVRRTLAEKLRDNRTRCKMSQEFVAEAVGVSRQAVSKWETGASDPSTANLLALAKLYGVTAEELLEGLQAGQA